MANKCGNFPNSKNRTPAIPSISSLIKNTGSICPAGRFFKSIHNELRKLRKVLRGFSVVSVAPPTWYTTL